MGHEAEVGHVHEADPQEGSLVPVLAALVDHIHQRNQSLLPDHQRGEDLAPQGVLNLVLVHVHVHRHSAAFLLCSILFFIVLTYEKA